MSNCKDKWRRRLDGLYECPDCKTVRKRPSQRPCKPDARPSTPKSRNRQRKGVPRLPVRILGWIRESAVFVALSAWRREWQVRSDEEMAAVREICRNCPDDRWDENNQQCLDCGCGGKSKFVLLNMHKMASKKCQRGYWEVTDSTRPAGFASESRDHPDR